MSCFVSSALSFPNCGVTLCFVSEIFSMGMLMKVREHLGVAWRMTCCSSDIIPPDS